MENNYEKLGKRLMCILYPGLVENEKNMLKTLGGINKISEVNKKISVRKTNF